MYSLLQCFIYSMTIVLILISLSIAIVVIIIFNNFGVTILE